MATNLSRKQADFHQCNLNQSSPKKINHFLLIAKCKLIQMSCLFIITSKNIIFQYSERLRFNQMFLNHFVHSINGFAYKIYSLKYLVEKGSRALQFSNKYAILKQRKNKNLLYLDGTIFDSHYIAMRLSSYEITLRDFLRAVRDPSELPEKLLQVVKGVRELYSIGFVHRDLKPDNIMINFNPIRVAVIDFNRAVRKEILLQEQFYELQDTSQSEKNGIMEVSNGIYGAQQQSYQSVK